MTRLALLQRPSLLQSAKPSSLVVLLPLGEPARMLWLTANFLPLEVRMNMGVPVAPMPMPLTLAAVVVVVKRARSVAPPSMMLMPKV
jgi:hypothetical protein